MGTVAKRNTAVASAGLSQDDGRVLQWLIVLAGLVDGSPKGDDGRLDDKKLALFARALHHNVDVSAFDEAMAFAAAAEFRWWPSINPLVIFLREQAGIRTSAILARQEGGTLHGLTSEEVLIIRRWRAQPEGSVGRLVMLQVLRDRHPEAAKRLVELGELPRPHVPSQAEREAVARIVRDMQAHLIQRDRDALKARGDRPHHASEAQLIRLGAYRVPRHDDAWNV